MKTLLIRLFQSLSLEPNQVLPEVLLQLAAWIKKLPEIANEVSVDATASLQVFPSLDNTTRL